LPVLNQVKYHFYDHLYFVPNSIIILDYLLTLFAMVVSQDYHQSALSRIENALTKPIRRAIIFGAGEAGLITKRAR
jgi:hypothetical protein